MALGTVKGSIVGILSHASSWPRTEKKILLDLGAAAVEVDTKLKESFPKLEKAGGYRLLWTTGQGN